MALWTQKGSSPYEIVLMDILHNMLLVMMKHVMQWTKNFLQKH